MSMSLSAASASASMSACSFAAAAVPFNAASPAESSPSSPSFSFSSSSASGSSMLFLIISSAFPSNSLPLRASASDAHGLPPRNLRIGTRLPSKLIPETFGASLSRPTSTRPSAAFKPLPLRSSSSYVLLARRSAHGIVPNSSRLLWLRTEKASSSATMPVMSLLVVS